MDIVSVFSQSVTIEMSEASQETLWHNNYKVVNGVKSGKPILKDVQERLGHAICAGDRRKREKPGTLMFLK